MEFQEYVDGLKKVFISEECAAEIKKAKEEFIAGGGELDREMGEHSDLLDIFFDWYIFDRPWPGECVAPVSLFMKNRNISEGDRDIYTGFTKFIHSIFVVRKKIKNIRVQDIFTNNKYEVANDSTALLEKRDVFEARLLPFRGHYGFSGAFCFYPRSIYPIIKEKAKEARSQGVTDFTIVIRKFRKLKSAWRKCAGMDIRKVYMLMEEGMFT